VGGALLDIREMYSKEGVPYVLPGKKGIALTLAQVEALFASRKEILAAMREATSSAAVGAAAEDVTLTLFVLPFGSVLRNANATRGAHLKGFVAYKASPGGADDDCTLILDLYPDAQLGLQGLGAPRELYGTHPLARAHGKLGSMLSVAATRALSTAPKACLRSI